MTRVDPDKLTRGELHVLAALSKAPMGIGSIHAVAKRAGVAYSTARRALPRLVDDELVTATREVVARGRAMEATVYRVNVRHPQWFTDVWGKVLNVDLTPLPVVTTRDPEVPKRLRHLFWNTHPDQLQIANAGRYIAKRLLSTWSFDGIAWGARNLPAEAWESVTKDREFDDYQKAMALNIASDIRRRDNSHRGETNEYT